MSGRTGDTVNEVRVHTGGETTLGTKLIAITGVGDGETAQADAVPGAANGAAEGPANGAVPHPVPPSAATTPEGGKPSTPGDEFKTVLEGQKGLVGRLMGMVGPSAVDMALRDRHAAIHKLVGRPGAEADARKQIEAYGNTSAMLQSIADKRQAVDTARQDLAAAGDAWFTDQARAADTALGARAAKVVADGAAAIGNPANTVLPAEVWDGADDEIGFARLVGTAKLDAKELNRQVLDAQKEAGDASGKLLGEAWTSALAEAGKALDQRKSAGAALQAVESSISGTSKLTSQVKLLRARGEAWSKDYDALNTRLASFEDNQRLQKHDGFVKSLRKDVAALGTLPDQMANAEDALDKIGTPIMQFTAAHKQVGAVADQFANVKGTAAALVTAVRDASNAAEAPWRTGKGDAQKDIEAVKAAVEALLPLTRELSNLQGKWAALQAFKPAEVDPGPLVEALNKVNGKTLLTMDFQALSGRTQEKLRIMPAVTAVDLLLAANGAALDGAAGGTATFPRIGEFLRGCEDKAKAKARTGDEAGARADLQRAIDQVPHISAVQADVLPHWKPSEAVLAGAIPPLATAIKDARQAVTTAVAKDDHAAAGLPGPALAALVAGGRTYTQAYGTAQALLDGTTGDAAKGPAAKAVQAALDAPLAPATDIAARTKALRDTARGLMDVAGDGAVAAALGKDDDATRRRFEGLFADPDAKAAALELAGALGVDELKALVAAIGPSDAPDPGAVAATALKGLKTGLGTAKIKELGEALGGLGGVGQLCADDGGTACATGVHAQFGADPKALGTLVADGFGGSAKAMREVVGGDAAKAKQLSDAFGYRGELKSMVGRFTDTAAAHAAMTAVAANNFGGDWTKLKDPFNDALKYAANGDHLYKKAANFTNQPIPNPLPQPANLQGWTSVDMAHVVKRHRPENFDFDDAKPNNSQFPPGTTPAGIAAIINDALAVLRAHLNGPADPAVTLYQQSASTKYDVVLPAHNMVLRVGIRFGAVNQAVPMPLAAAAGVKPDVFTESDMDNLKKALGR